MHKKELNVITLSVLSIVFLLMIGYALADLPIQGNHDGTWGTHLNDWLEIGHNLTSGAADNFTDASIVAADIGFRNITAALMGTVAVNSTHIADRSIIAILLGTGVINATHIGDRNITAANIGTGVINATHIGDRNITSVNIGTSVINTTHIINGTVQQENLGIFTSGISTAVTHSQLTSGVENSKNQTAVYVYVIADITEVGGTVGTNVSIVLTENQTAGSLISGGNRSFRLGTNERQTFIAMYLLSSVDNQPFALNSTIYGLSGDTINTHE